MASAPQAERPVGVRIPVRDGSRGRLTQRLPMALAVGVSETPAWTYQLWEAQVRVRHLAARRRSRRLRARSFNLSLPQWKRLSWGEGCHPPPPFCFCPWHAAGEGQGAPHGLAVLGAGLAAKASPRKGTWHVRRLGSGRRGWSKGQETESTEH